MNGRTIAAGSHNSESLARCRADTARPTYDLDLIITDALFLDIATAEANYRDQAVPPSQRFCPSSSARKARLSFYPDQLESTGFVLLGVSQVSWWMAEAGCYSVLLRWPTDLEENRPTLASSFS